MSGQTILQAIQFARRQMGIPYVWGGESRREGGFDCSGLIYAAYHAAGYQGIGRTTYDQIRQGVRVDPRRVQPGDLVFSSPHHVGLYIGGGQVISAPHTGANVHRIPLAQFGGIYQVRRLTAGGGGLRVPAGGAAVGPGGLPIPRGGSSQATAMNIALLAAAKPIQLSRPMANLPTAQETLQRLSPALQPAAAVQSPAIPKLGQVAPQAPAPSAIADTSAQLEGIRKRLLGVA